MDEQAKGDSISANISGDVSGQVAVGKRITQQKNVGAGKVEITEADLEELRKQFDDLRAQVQLQAPPDKKEAALERVDELQKAVNPQKPRISTMEYVTDWFCDNLPALAGAVGSVVVHPIVGKVVEAAGDLAAQEFKRRFGHKDT